MTKVYYPAIYPAGLSPGQRFRIEQYMPYLKENGIDVEMAPYFSEQDFKTIYSKGNVASKIIAVLNGFVKRIMQLPKAAASDFIYIQRDVTPIGPPVFEWIYKFIFKKKIIFDFDDAVWMPGTVRTFFSKFRSYDKVGKIIKWSYATAAGNYFLLEYARKYSDKAIRLPTVVDTETLHNQIKDQHTKQIVIGWTGTFSTNYYMTEVADALGQLHQQYGTHFLVISNNDPCLESTPYEYIEWRESSEIDDLLKINIGLMPLLGGDWEKGKCGFKAIQFMALGIPVLASDVGANSDVITHGVDSYLYSNIEEFKKILELLITEPQLREKMGIQARNKIKQEFSVASNLDKMIQLFK